MVAGPMSAILQELPLPARLVPWNPALHTTLARCVLLALLLHLWAVLMLGTAPGGTARPGEGVGGRLNITLRGPVADGASTTPQPAPTPAPGTAAETALPRWGGVVRTREPSAESLPGAAQLGLPAAPAPLPDVPDTTVRTAPAPAPAPPSPEPGRVLQERAAEPEPVPPPPTPVPEPVPAEGRLLAPAPAAPVNNLRLSSQAPLPVIEPLALPEGPSASVAQPAPARELVSPVLQGPRVAPVPALPAPQPLVPSAQLPQATPLPAPSAVPDTLPRAPAPAPPSAAAPAAATPLPQADASPADAGSRIGHDVATPGAAAASAPKKLNLELVRPRGGELSRWGSAGVLPVLPRLPERDEKLAREIEKAGKADCSKAYRDAGLLAVVPLVADALKKDGGCKW
jgi:hypothetical protein